MLQECIKKLVLGEDLSFQESYESMNEILDGKSSPVQNTAFLTALACRKREEENITEITAFAKAMREHATEVKHEGMEVLEIVGTGGDHSNSYNISTTSALVVASLGVKVAKERERWRTFQRHLARSRVDRHGQPIQEHFRWSWR